MVIKLAKWRAHVERMHLRKLPATLMLVLGLLLAPGAVAQAAPAHQATSSSGCSGDSLREAVIAHAGGQYDKLQVNHVGCDGGEGFIEQTVQDDSVAAVRHYLVLEFQNGAWVVVSDTHTVRCQVGRGHQEFSSDPCL